MTIDDHDRKAKLWTFIFTSFTNDDVNRLSNLPPNFMHTSFAVCEDETGNRFLQGLARTKDRIHKRVLRRSIGNNATHDIPVTLEDILCCVVTTIQLSSSPKESGSMKGSRFEGYLEEIKEFEAATNCGMTPSNKLMKRHPKVCLCFPLQVMKCLNKMPKESLSCHQKHAVVAHNKATTKGSCKLCQNIANPLTDLATVSLNPQT